MALKWKIYYLCGVYLCVWTVAMAGLFLYILVAPGYGVVNAPVSVPLFLCVLGITGCKGLLSLWFTGYLKRGDIFTLREEKMFRFLYQCTVVLAAAGVLLLATQLPAEAGRLRYLPTMEIVLQSGVVLTAACLLFMSATGYGLVKTIRESHYNGLMLHADDGSAHEN